MRIRAELSQTLLVYPQQSDITQALLAVYMQRKGIPGHCRTVFSVYLASVPSATLLQPGRTVKPLPFVHRPYLYLIRHKITTVIDVALEGDIYAHEQVFQMREWIDRYVDKKTGR